MNKPPMVAKTRKSFTKQSAPKTDRCSLFETVMLAYCSFHNYDAAALSFAFAKEKFVTKLKFSVLL